MNLIRKRMARRFYSSLFVVIGSGLCVLFPQPGLCQKEPAVKIEVVSDGETISLFDGDTVILHGHKTVIRTGRTKTFQLDGLEFQYPRDFAYRYEQESGVKTWTFDGNNFVIMLFEFERKADIAAFTRIMVRKFGKKNCSVEDRTLQLASQALKGKRILVSLLGAKLTFDLYPLDLSSKKTHIIAFQDTKNNNGGDSKEGVETMAVITNTIHLLTQP